MPTPEKNSRNQWLYEDHEKRKFSYPELSEKYKISFSRARRIYLMMKSEKIMSPPSLLLPPSPSRPTGEMRRPRKSPGSVRAACSSSWIAAVRPWPRS